jgi:ATP-dependent Lhr-like helicase
MNEEKALQARLARTWGAFFARHGNFTETQRLAIPLLLDGKNLVLSAPTASGKTEAVLAPLVENYLFPLRSQALRILYILPTRALIHDLFKRLKPICENLQISLAMKTHDFNDFNPQAPSDILLTTPESLDSLLANQAKTLIHLQAVILDELHSLDNTVRGDQLRILLKRLQQIRDYAYSQEDTETPKVQYVALSATFSESRLFDERYLPNPTSLTIRGQRQIHAEFIPLDPENPQVLLEYFAIFQARGWRKALAFCNTRAEVEAYAMFIRQAKTAFGEQVFTHYSNLAPERRHEIEKQFAESSAALCLATNTLELGIDIGSIDLVLLIGAPSDSAAFYQRIGRANRRQRRTQMACFYRSHLEQMLFELLPSLEPNNIVAPFRLSVLIQQLFSLLKQSPSHALRLAPLSKLLGDFVSQHELEQILGHLQALDYLKVARLGEWRAGTRLNKLIDQQAYQDKSLSLYSNIDSVNQQSVEVRDKYSQKIIARVDRQWLARDSLTLEGQPLNVLWQDKRHLWVSNSAKADDSDSTPFYLSARQFLSFELAQALGKQLNWQTNTAPFVKDAQGGVYLFHWLGAIYGQIFYDLLRPYRHVYKTSQVELCLYFAEVPQTFPVWQESEIETYLKRHFMSYESLLQLGAYHFLLPKALRKKEVIRQLNLPRFLDSVQLLHSVEASEKDASQLLELLL